MSREMKKKIFGWSAVMTNLVLSTIELLIICKIVPYDIIMGGRMDSYETAVGGAVFSILLQLFITCMLLIASGIVKIMCLAKVSKVVLRVCRVYLVLNIGMNLLGKTWFERIIASLFAVFEIVCITQIVKKEELDT